MNGQVPTLLTVAGGILVALAAAALVGWRAHRADWGHGLINILDGWLRLYCRYFQRLRVTTPLDLPPRGAALVVANHLTGLDPFLLIAACDRPLRFLIAREQYERPLVRQLFRAVGGIPVDRDGNPREALRAALAALAAGEVVALFPEGGIHPPGQPPARLKRGVARLAKLSGAPIYAAQLSGMRGAGHLLRALVLPGRTRVRGFPPLDCHALEEVDCLAQLAQRLNRKS